MIAGFNTILAAASQLSLCCKLLCRVAGKSWIFPKLSRTLSYYFNLSSWIFCH